MWIWRLALGLEKKNSLLINRCIQLDTGTPRAKMEEGLLAGPAVLETVYRGAPRADGHKEGPKWQGIPISLPKGL